MTVKNLIDKLCTTHFLTKEEYIYILSHFTRDDARYAAKCAVNVRQKIYGRDVYIRGLIEISNHCKNDCLYCGIRKSNISCTRYRLLNDEILACCDSGYKLGFRTFVLQGGEDMFYTDSVLCALISSIKEKYEDCAVTLSLGERSDDSYRALFCAGADRYLLRHETANKEHYNLLHPPKMSYENRMRCLYSLKKAGFQTGCGFMVGSPYQTFETIADDLKFIESFKPEMCGIGPFIPHSATPFSDKARGSVELTLFCLSLVRLIVPTVLLPATTALGTADDTGREKGILAGANVIMPNLSPISQRKKYELYNGKAISGNEDAMELENIKNQIEKIGYRVNMSRGDVKREE